MRWRMKLTKKFPKGTKIKPTNKSPRNFVLIWRSFAEGYNFKRVILEVTIPILLSLLVVLIAVLSKISISDVFLRIEKMNEQIADIIAIQVGFNITCMALIASFNRDTLKNVFSKVQDTKKESALKQLISSFTYCIFVQTGILIFGILYNTSVEDFLGIDLLKEINHSLKLFIVLSFFFLWLSIIIHSFIVFLRNVTLIYKFILVVFKSANSS